MIGTGYKCDQCGYLEVDARYWDNIQRFTPGLPAGWLMVGVMPTEDKGQDVEGKHFCSGLCARNWLLNQECDGKIRDNNPTVKTVEGQTYYWHKGSGPDPYEMGQDHAEGS